MTDVFTVMMAIWIFVGIVQWVRAPMNEFAWDDFLIGLPLVILFWPRTLNKK